MTVGTIRGIFGCALLAFVLLYPEGTFAALKTGQAAPVFSVKPAETGKQEFSLDEHVGPARSDRSKGVALSFFASWCLPCRTELPLLNSLVDELNGKGVTIVIIGVKEGYDKIGPLLQELEVDKPVVLSDHDGRITALYQVRFLPTTFFVGSDGLVKDIIFGEIRNAADLRKSIELLMK